MKRQALFLDRDGTINIDYGYVYRQKDFHFIDGVFELVAAAKRLDYLVVIITNQSGIGRGYYTETEFQVLMTWVNEQFAQRGGAIDAVFFCPDHPEHGQGIYRRDTLMRKPGPGMLLKAAEVWNIDLGQSILVGDSEADIKAGQLAEVRHICYLGDVDPCNDLGIKKISRLIEVIPLLQTCSDKYTSRK
jgi:D-glycero-D-manno-heptose 1,7-bisphosphate phosphatase